jgi:hypothetical protein
MNKKKERNKKREEKEKPEMQIKILKSNLI